MAKSTPQKLSFADVVTVDPRLPRPQPTQAFWQHVPHALAEIRSSSLPPETDVVVIGSGMTGVAVTKTLLEGDHQLRVSVLEARTLCSGATGRNGGQLAINAAETYEDLRAAVGPEMAGKIVNFTIRTLDRVREVVREYDIEQAAELRDLVKLRAFLDEPAFCKMKRGIALMESDHPSLRGIYRLIDADACAQAFGVIGAVGGAVLPAGTIWPYRMVCAVFQALKDRFSDRLNIETETPVISVSHDPATNPIHPYIAETPRGLVRARKVVYCTNGYTGHLLPKLRGPIVPVTGTMTVQQLDAAVPNKGAIHSWAIHQTPTLDANTGLSHDGLQYLSQSPESGFFYHGGDKTGSIEWICADDDRMFPTSVEFLQDSLPKFFGATQSKLFSAWSGVMCFSADGVPLVGHLPASVTTRQGTEEWIAGVYNGYGMPNAYLAGESLAKLVLGEKPPYLPEAYELTEARLQSSLTTEKTLSMLTGFTPPSQVTHPVESVL